MLQLGVAEEVRQAEARRLCCLLGSPSIMGLIRARCVVLYYDRAKSSIIQYHKLDWRPLFKHKNPETFKLSLGLSGPSGAIGAYWRFRVR